MNSFEKIVFDFTNIVGMKTKSLYVKNESIYCFLEKDEMLLQIANFVKEKKGRTITINIVKKEESYISNYIFHLQKNILINIEIEKKDKIMNSISSVLKCSSFFQDELIKKYRIKFIEENNKKVLEKRIGKFDTNTSILEDIAEFEYETKDEIIKNVEINVKKSISLPQKNIDYLNSFYRNSTNNNALIYSLAIEEIAKIEVSKKVKLIRMITEELIRVSSHLFNFSICAHLLNIDNLMITAIKARNIIQDTKELLWNSKLDCNINIIGGVRHDISEIKKKNSLKKIDEFSKEFEIFYKIVVNEKKLNGMIDFGKISNGNVHKFGLTGPIARASNVNNDVRDCNSYLLYEELSFQSIIKNKEDAYSRIFVRLEEIFESIRIIKLSLELLPNKSLEKIKKISIPKGEATVRIEAPRGELFYYIRSEGLNKISKIITRTPTSMNWQMLKEIIPNNNINQMPLLFNSIDPCVTCSLEM